LSRAIGLSLPTIKAWAGVLDASFLCFFLPPYFRNYGKRLIKTPKLYYLDPALVCSLTRQPDGNSALAGPMGGPLFEGLITGEAVKVFALKGRRPDIFFWRSHDGLEVDLVIQIKNRLYPVEIKLTATPTLRHLEPLTRFKALAGNDASEDGLLVCRVKKITPMPENNTAIPWDYFPEWLHAKLA